MNYEAAIIFLADAVAAAPFEMENFRKYGFWAKVAIKAAENGKLNISRKALNEMMELEDKIDIFADVTGVMPAIYEEALNAHRAAARAAA